MHKDHALLGVDQRLRRDLGAPLDALVLVEVSEPLLLHASDVEDVGLGDDVVDRDVLRNGDLGLDLLHDRLRHLEPLGRHELDLHVVQCEQARERVDGPAVLEVAAEGDGEAVDGADLLADGEDVEQRLGGVLADPVARVDDGLADDLGGALDGALVGVPQHDHVAVALHCADEILEALALGDARGGHVLHADDGAAQALHGGGEGARRARGGLVEDAAHDHPAQHVEGPALREHAHVVREVEELVHEGAVELLHAEHRNPPHLEQPRRLVVDVLRHLRRSHDAG
mmetsp:Transcript_26756/g.65908  ORF Transcript_26756/g.65908 Transcript_26756/m.65908 type:complete len:285 (-) Transcript_26756:5955-6809(-)